MPPYWNSFIPAVALQPYVKCYAEIRLGSPSQQMQCCLPAKPEQCIFVSTGAQAVITKENGNNLLSESLCCNVRGAVNGATLDLQFTGVLEMFVVLFKPGGFAKLLGVPANEYQDIFVPAALSLGAVWENMGQEIREATSAMARVRIAEKRLLSFLPKITLTTAMDHLFDFPGVTPQLSVSRMAQKVYLSERQFRRLFTERIGIAPAAFNRICRLNAVIRAKKQLADISWRQLAFANGYTDQSHLAREMKDLMGMTRISGAGEEKFLDVGGTIFRDISR